MNIEDLKAIAGPACGQFSVKRLDAFGSIARGTSQRTSDVDLLVEFEKPEERLAQRFFGLLHYMEDHLGCEVDLITVGSLRNPYFRERVMKERVPVYEG